MPTLISTVTNTSGLSTSQSQSIDIAVPPPVGGLSIELALSTGTLTFAQDDATELAPYTGPFVQQRCFILNSGSWTIFFRPDVGGLRDEIIIELGSMFNFATIPPSTLSGLTPAHILTPYTATVRRNSTVLATVNVPRHYWAARWRWQSAPRPLVRTYADILSLKALPPMSSAFMWGVLPTISSIPYTGPMTSHGVTTGMGTAGDRPELGHITEHQAAWLLAGNTSGRTTMLTQAEVTAFMPLHVRDKDTLAPLNVQTHPYLAQVFPTSSNTKIPLAPRLSFAADPNFFNTQAAHYPDLTFIPWLLTDDPYFLEECQFNAVYHSTESNYHQAAEHLPGMVSPSETRGWAWGMRDVSRASSFPASLPSWFLPKTEIKKNLNNCLTFFNKYLASTIPSCQIFHIGPQTNIASSWMIGYHESVLGWMKWSGFFPEWDAVADYVMSVTLNLSALPAESGWDRRWPAPYQLNILSLRTLAPTGGQPVSDPEYNHSSYDANTPVTWAEAFALFTTWVNAQPHTVAFNDPPWTDDKLYQNPTDYPYGSNATANSTVLYLDIQRSCLALCVLNSYPNAQDKYNWFVSKFPDAVTAFAGQGTQYRHAFATS